jgi:hypothetical protein
MKKNIFIALFIAISAGTASANILDSEAVMIPVVITAGGVLSANPALSAALNAVFETAMLVGAGEVTYVVSTNQKEKLVQAKAVIVKEVVDYQATGEIGLVLDTGVRAMKEKNLELSDAEAIDTLIEALY